MNNPEGERPVNPPSAPAAAVNNPLAKLGAPLPFEAVEFRVQSINKDGWAVLLAYKNARVDMDRLDQVLGIGYWQRKHERIDGREYCHVGVWNAALKDWVWVSDVGVPSKSDAVKGEASDAFKRACFNLGIGRELYDMPFILVQLRPDEFTTYEEKGKVRGQASYNLRLREWVWHCKRSDPDENGKTTVESLVAIDDSGKERFRYPRRGGGSTEGQQQNDERRGQQSSGQRPAGGNKQPARSNNQQQGGQGAQGSADTANNKPWYDDFDKDRAWMIDQFKKGIAADAMIALKKERYKLNRKTEQEIKELAAEVAEGQH